MAFQEITPRVIYQGDIATVSSAQPGALPVEVVLGSDGKTLTFFAPPESPQPVAAITEVFLEDGVDITPSEDGNPTPSEVLSALDALGLTTNIIATYNGTSSRSAPSTHVMFRENATGISEWVKPDAAPVSLPLLVATASVTQQLASNTYGNLAFDTILEDVDWNAPTGAQLAYQVPSTGRYRVRFILEGTASPSVDAMVVSRSHINGAVVVGSRGQFPGRTMQSWSCVSEFTRTLTAGQFLSFTAGVFVPGGIANTTYIATASLEAYRIPTEF